MDIVDETRKALNGGKSKVILADAPKELVEAEQTKHDKGYKLAFGTGFGDRKAFVESLPECAHCERKGENCIERDDEDGICLLSDKEIEILIISLAKARSPKTFTQDEVEHILDQCNKDLVIAATWRHVFEGNLLVDIRDDGEIVFKENKELEDGGIEEE